MDFNFYQEEAYKTAIYPNKGENFTYPTLGLVGESGEIAEKIKKVLRDNGGELTPSIIEDIKFEIGDVLWYCAALAKELGITLDDIATANIIKLKSRQDRAVLHGSGDNR